MLTPMQTLEKVNTKIKPQWKTAFLSTLVIGLLIHMPALLSDIPNHDGLDSMYFDQNMITSGRWFLTVACGFSSYFSIPWMIGLLGLLFLAGTSVVLTELLELKDKTVVCLVSGLLVAFPAFASTVAYVFTLDGYMLAMFLATLSVLLVKKFRYGFLAGAVCLAFSVGTYQAYLSFAVILCVYMIVRLLIEQGEWKDKLRKVCRYLLMGVIGLILYVVVLSVLLAVQGKELASYQGISGMGNVAGTGLLGSIKNIYIDFVSFTGAGNILFNNVFSGLAVAVLAVCLIVTVVRKTIGGKWWKKLTFYAVLLLLALGLPVATNLILIISPDVTYHLLMRYQWVLYLIIAVDFVSRYAGKQNTVCADFRECMERTGGCVSGWLCWAASVAAVILIFNYAVTDNIAYANLEKKYEKTYAYCVRLLDRIEQTEGYYQGIPIAMIGVVGDEQFPVTDITGEFTGNMIGMNGDSLLYTGANYEAFMKHYLGATLNFLEPEVMNDIYYSDEYVEMDSFPGKNSVKVVDGIMYVKTENKNRD
ncbi:MAG: hypothetical protein E7287_03065 [Lachnospiraceae bacterium]|nr:hypothetical protein [Lachnospiraceae bacterium]